METQQTPIQSAAPRPRPARRRQAERDRHHGDLVNRVENLQHIARCVEVAMTYGVSTLSAQGAVEHLADQLDQLADQLATMDIRPPASALRAVPAAGGAS